MYKKWGEGRGQNLSYNRWENQIKFSCVTHFYSIHAAKLDRYAVYDYDYYYY